MKNTNARNTFELGSGMMIGAGEVEGFSALLKFGRTKNADNGIDTDVWDGANSTDDIDVWVAPTEARVHEIASDNVADTATTGGGARKIKVYGLTAWDSEEVSEEIEMNGTTAVDTTNSYVIIHRIKVVECGGTSVNVGKIKATAKVDGTVTAMILAEEGQTQMAIYGVPEGKKLIINKYYISTVKRSASYALKVKLLVNPFPDEQVGNFLTKSTIGIATEGTNFIERNFEPSFRVEGPAIVKVQVNSSADNADVSAGFDGVMR